MPEWDPKLQYHSFTLMYVEGASLLAATEIFCSHFPHGCFPLEFIGRIIIVNGGKVKKNKSLESFMVFSDKRHLYVMWYCLLRRG